MSRLLTGVADDSFVLLKRLALRGGSRRGRGPLPSWSCFGNSLGGICQRLRHLFFFACKLLEIAEIKNMEYNSLYI